MPMPLHSLSTLAAAFLFVSTVPLFAQDPGRNEAKSEARAEARATGSQRVTHRVVVVNGKTVVDERTVDGTPGPGAGAGDPGLGGLDAEEMLRKLREQVEREAGGGLPPVDMPPLKQPPVKLPPPAKQPAVKQPPVKQPAVKQPPVQLPPPARPSAGSGKLEPLDRTRGSR